MKVSEVLAAKNNGIVTIRPGDSIAALSRLLKEKRIGAAVVSNDGLSIDGVISERDIAYGLATHTTAMSDLPVSTLMTRTVITCQPSDDIGAVASTMLSRNVRHLPVEKGGRLVGMVSIRDVLKSRLDELQQQTAQLRSFVHQVETVPPQDRE